MAEGKDRREGAFVRECGDEPGADCKSGWLDIVLVRRALLNGKKRALLGFWDGGPQSTDQALLRNVLKRE